MMDMGVMIGHAILIMSFLAVIVASYLIISESDRDSEEAKRFWEEYDRQNAQ